MIGSIADMSLVLVEVIDIIFAIIERRREIDIRTTIGITEI